MSKKISITVQPQNINVEGTQGEHLLGMLVKAGLPVDSYCGGRGTCGKCKVHIKGRMPAPSSLDLRFLRGDELRKGIRLACGLIPSDGDLVESISPQNVNSYKLQLDSIDFVVDPWQKKIPQGAVLAVDLGTTNIVGHVVDQATGRVIGSASRANSQAAFGADVMSRLTYASHQKPGGREILGSRARSDIELLVNDLDIIQPITDVVAVMNTAMEVLLIGHDPDMLGRYPCDSGISTPYHNCSFFTTDRLLHASLHVPTIIGGYVGSDTVAALLSLKTVSPKPPYILLDIGTNAEVVIVTDKAMVACSTAAGPAFEGMGIACGMRGVEGAVDRVFFRNGHLGFSTIGRTAPLGITGSGLFGLIGELLRSGTMDSYGMVNTGSLYPDEVRRGDQGNEIVLTPEVFVSEHDIQQFLLAKAATRAAVDTLLAKTGIQAGNLTALYVAGTFASMIAPRDIIAVGLIPPACADIMRSVGNAAATGAVMMAASKSRFNEACILAGQVRHLPLSGDRGFMEAFQSSVHF